MREGERERERRHFYQDFHISAVSQIEAVAISSDSRVHFLGIHFVYKYVVFSKTHLVTSLKGRGYCNACDVETLVPSRCFIDNFYICSLPCP